MNEDTKRDAENLVGCGCLALLAFVAAGGGPLILMALGLW